jgi:hypothetical protein
VAAAACVTRVWVGEHAWQVLCEVTGGVRAVLAVRVRTAPSVFGVPLSELEFVDAGDGARVRARDCMYACVVCTCVVAFCCVVRVFVCVCARARVCVFVFAMHVFLGVRVLFRVFRVRVRVYARARVRIFCVRAYVLLQLRLFVCMYVCVFVFLWVLTSAPCPHPAGLRVPRLLVDLRRSLIDGGGLTSVRMHARARHTHTHVFGYACACALVS